MKKGWLIVAGVVLVVAVIIAWRLTRPAAVVVTLSPRVGTIQAYVEEQAVTELPHDTLISMPISGWLERIDLREGDPVEEGQVIACLETDDLRDRVRQIEQQIAVLETKIAQTADNRLEEHALVETKAMVKAMDETVAASEAKLQASKAIAEFAETEVKRLRALSERDAAADRELREAEMQWRSRDANYRGDALELAALKTLDAVSYIGPQFIRDVIDRKSFDKTSYQQQIEETRAELEIAKRNLARAKIESPINGVVLERHQTRRQYLAAGTPLLTLGRLDELEVIAEVLTERATRIRPDDRVEIYGEALFDGPLTGHVTRVYPAGFKKISSLGVEQQRVKVAIALDKRPPQLGVAYRVYVRIIYDQADDAIIIPRTAMFRSPSGRWQVMLVRDGRTVLQPIELGLTNDDDAQVVKGLAPEDVLVAEPSRDLDPHMRVATQPQH